ncbi:BTE_collapsed_G0044500.mRNA.1.CDS.1 [Saccharomyces cerevisiae]|nr:BTE_collapsed_G0044500.mRNA.1.CDS.1 [Saccharomyces cerevisiae]
MHEGKLRTLCEAESIESGNYTANLRNGPTDFQPLADVLSLKPRQFKLIGSNTVAKLLQVSSDLTDQIDTGITHQLSIKLFKQEAIETVARLIHKCTD